MTGTVGIIANPSSGKDIRRLVARGSVFDNNEKINIVRRALLGLDSVGVRRVVFMPDYFAIVPRAVDGAHLSLQSDVLPMVVDATQRDSTRAAELMAAAGVACIITLGGDGTNRAVAKAKGSAPLVPVSTGTNNVFPSMVEGTLAGLAAGLVATGAVEAAEVVRPTKRLEVLLDGEEVDLALVDVAFSRERFVGSRAIWDPAGIRELVLASAEPGRLGLSAIGAHLHPVGRDAAQGLYLRLADPHSQPLSREAGASQDSAACGRARCWHLREGCQRRGEGAPDQAVRVMAPIAPGLIVPVGVRAHRTVQIGEVVELEPAYGSLALDGERELIVKPSQRVAVRLTFDGPRVVDIQRALALAARKGCFLAS